MPDSENVVLEKLMKIEAKLNASHVLNGGFEKLVLDVRHTNEQISAMKISLDQMNTTINDPEEGVRSRVRDLESESHRRWDFVQEAKAKIDEFDDLLSWKKEVEEKINLVDRHNLDLDRLKIWQANLSKIQWLFGSTILILIIKTLLGVVLP